MDISTERFTPHDLDWLSAFLASGRCPPSTLTIHQLRGFLWSMVSSPIELTPADWLTVILGDDDGHPPPFDSQADFDRFLTLAGRFHEQLRQQFLDRRFRFPDDYVYSEHPDLMLPLSQWCQGLLTGHAWLRPAWDEACEVVEIDDGSSLRAALDAMLGWVSTFADVPAALAAATDPDALRQRLPQSFADHLPKILLDYAQIGHELRRLARELNTVYAHIGRNDACPCGSGRKFKKCCMA